MYVCALTQTMTHSRVCAGWVFSPFLCVCVEFDWFRSLTSLVDVEVPVHIGSVVIQVKVRTLLA